MEIFNQFMAWYSVHGTDLGALLIQIMIAGEAAVKVFPTERGEGFVHRLGEVIDWCMKWLPNNSKKPPVLP